MVRQLLSAQSVPANLRKLVGIGWVGTLVYFALQKIQAKKEKNINKRKKYVLGL